MEWDSIKFNTEILNFNIYKMNNSNYNEQRDKIETLKITKCQSLSRIKEQADSTTTSLVHYNNNRFSLFFFIFFYVLHFLNYTSAINYYASNRERKLLSVKNLRATNHHHNTARHFQHSQKPLSPKVSIKTTSIPTNSLEWRAPVVVSMRGVRCSHWLWDVLVAHHHVISSSHQL